jgi:preprotein translocase subunit SecE
MNTKTDTTSKYKFDFFIWLLVVLLIAAGIVGFYYFAEYSFLLRVIILLVVMSLAGLLASTTKKGQATLFFLRESHLEIRRVVWPTRQETLQMTGVVLLMVVLVALIIWFLDSILLWLVRLITGQGG